MFFLYFGRPADDFVNDKRAVEDLTVLNKSRLNRVDEEVKYFLIRKARTLERIL